MPSGGSMSILAPARVIEIPQDDDALESVIAATPDCPAVFLLWPLEGSPYLARTSLLRRRLNRLLKASGTARRALNLRAVAAQVEYWPAGSKLESSLLFYRLARKHFPGMYLKMAKLRMPPYVKLILSNAFPRTQVTARLGRSRAIYYGPFASRAAATQFETKMLDLFQIRRCQEDLAPSPSHPGCIYGEMSMCLRPCQQIVGAEEYQSEVERVVGFLSSRGRSLTEALSAARERLSSEMNFEEAASVHKKLEKVEQCWRESGGLVRSIDQLNGVVVTPSALPGAAQLWFVAAGTWGEAVHFDFEIKDGRAVSIDRRLREIVTSIKRPDIGIDERQEHLALLARWYYSSWRDGEWIPFESADRVPYRKLVNAVSRAASGIQNQKQEAPPAIPAP